MKTVASHAIAAKPGPAPGRAPPLAGRAARRGPANQVLQAKLEIGRSDDSLEREADRIAEQEVRGDNVAAMAATSSAPAIRPKCSECAAEEDGEEIRMKEEAGARPSAAAAQSGTAEAANALSESGTPLSADLRAYFEPRFGRDFSDVRLHLDTAADSAANRLGARAYMLGNDIAFARGEYAPASHEGRRLIAHELGHVVQQSRGAPIVIRRDVEGTTEFRERVTSQPTRTGSVWRGAVERTEVVPASGTEPEAEVHRSTVGVTFNERTCTVGVTKRVKFQQVGTSEYCAGPPPSSEAVDPLSADEFSKVKRDYITTVNDGLNGWYTARLEGAACAAPCMGGDLTIDARMVEDEANPEYTIDVVNRAGRGRANTLCVRQGGFRDYAIHEAGHTVLGLGDEYAETDPAVCKKVPEWCRKERIRRKDWSRMGETFDYGRFALFHERHFQFVPAFLRATFPDCTARLVEMSRPTLPDFQWGLSVGAASLGGRPAFLASAGIGLGIPLDRLREVEATIGIQGTAVLASEPALRSALLLGLRAGIERRATPSAGGLTGGIFAEAGYGRFSTTELEPYRRYESGAPYGQVGLHFGYSFAPGTLGQAFVGAEVTAGSALTTTGMIGDPGAAGGVDETWRRWYGLGLSLGVRH